MEIKITLNGKQVKMSRRDNNERLAHKLAQAAVREINAPGDGTYRNRLVWWRHYYEARRDNATKWIDTTPEKRLLLALFGPPQKRRKLQTEARIWELRRMVAEEVLGAIEELMR